MSQAPRGIPAPPWQIVRWFNSPGPLRLEELRGRVIFAHAFQMRCRGCLDYGIPQAMRVQEHFGEGGVVVVGLHTVFEHHGTQGEDALEAFLRERRITFPVGVDAPPTDGEIRPRTMRAYDMQGTPTSLLIDARGRLRRQVLGPHPDLLLGAELQALLLEASELAASEGRDSG